MLAILKALLLRMGTTGKIVFQGVGRSSIGSVKQLCRHQELTQRVGLFTSFGQSMVQATGLCGASVP